jgi:hypothetical protein
MAESYDINTHHINSSVELLLLHLDKPLEEVESNHELNHAYNLIKVLTRLGYKTELYNSLLRYLKERKPANIKPNTIGDFLYGCINHPNACSLSCLTGVIPDISRCTDQVWIVKNGNLEPLNSENSDKAYIYSDVLLSPSNVERLRKLGIKHITILNGNQTLYTGTLDNMPNTIPVRPKQSGSSFLSIVVTIIVIIILVLVALILWRLYHKKMN